MQEAEKMLNGKTILITGGTGSFGNAFTEYVLTHYDPKKIIIYSRDEFKQFNMANKFKKYVCRPNLQANKNIHTNPNLYENEDKKI